MGKKKNDVGMSENQTSGSKQKALWNKVIIDIFIDLCIKEVELGNRPGTCLNKDGYANLMEKLNKAIGKTYDRLQLNNKWDLLRKDWKLWKDLKGKETGLGWSHTKNTVDASDEWWADKIKMEPRYKPFQSAGIPPDMEEKLDMMFCNTIATGKHAWAPSSGVVPQSIELETDDGSPIEGGGDSDESAPIEITPASITIENKGQKRKYQPFNIEDRRKKKGSGGGKLDGAAKLSLQIERLVDAAETRTSTSEPSVKNGGETSIGEVMNDIVTLPGVERGSKLWWFATKLFCAQEKREMYVHMGEPDLKLQFLKLEFGEN